MLKRLFVLPLLTVFAAPLALPAPAFAQAPQAAAAVSSTPLLTIRFNQRSLYLDKAVYNAVNAAKAAKPDVIFNVTLLPALQGGDDGNAGKVINALRSADVPDAQIRNTRGGTSGQPYDIVQVFVQ